MVFRFLRQGEQGRGIKSDHRSELHPISVQEHGLVMRALESQRSGGCLTRASTAWGARIINGWPRVSLLASLVRTAIAATIRRQGGHPEATGSSFFER